VQPFAASMGHGSLRHYAPTQEVPAVTVAARAAAVASTFVNRLRPSSTTASGRDYDLDSLVPRRAVLARPFSTSHLGHLRPPPTPAPHTSTPTPPPPASALPITRFPNPSLPSPSHPCCDSLVDPLFAARRPRFHVLACTRSRSPSARLARLRS
jgi:hypothetical protein